MAKQQTTEQSASKPKKKGIVRRSIGAVYSVLGFKDIAHGVGMHVENLEDTAQRSKSLYRAYRDAIFKKHVARKESFEEAVERLNLSTSALQARRKELATTSYIFMAIFAGTFYFLIDALLNGDLLTAFSLLTISMTIGALVFSFRFRVWQIDHKRLAGPQEYIYSLLGRS